MLQNNCLILQFSGVTIFLDVRRECWDKPSACELASAAFL